VLFCNIAYVGLNELQLFSRGRTTGDIDMYHHRASFHHVNVNSMVLRAAALSHTTVKHMQELIVFVA